jgi:hypothetical protein
MVVSVTRLCHFELPSGARYLQEPKHLGSDRPKLDVGAGGLRLSAGGEQTSQAGGIDEENIA